MLALEIVTTKGQTGRFDFQEDFEMIVARMHQAAAALFVALIVPLVAFGQGPKAPAKGGVVRCCGLALRTDFGNPERMTELALKPETVFVTCRANTKIDELVAAYEAYLEAVDSEFGQSEKRDVLRSRLTEVFRTAAKDKARSALLIEGIRQFNFGRTLQAKGLKSKAIDEVKQSRATVARAVKPESFVLMYIDLFLVSSLTESGETEEALTIAQTVTSRAVTVYGERDEYVGFALGTLAKAQIACGKFPQAEKSSRQALTILADSLEVQPNNYFYYCNELAETYIAQSKFAEAAEMMAYLEPQIRKFLKDDFDPAVFNAVSMRAKALIGLERFDDAEKVLGKFPSTIPSLREPSEAGRNLLEVAADLYDKTGRSNLAGPARKNIARIDAKLDKPTQR